MLLAETQEAADVHALDLGFQGPVEVQDLTDEEQVCLGLEHLDDDADLPVLKGHGATRDNGARGRGVHVTTDP